MNRNVSEDKLGAPQAGASGTAVLDERQPAWFHIPLKHLLILLACAFFLFFFRMGAQDLWSPDEARYAQVAREMLRSDDWIVLHLNDEIYTEKPPLFFWAVAALSKPFGDVSETTARLPSAAAAALMMLLTYLLGANLLGRREALLGTLVMATSAQFVWIGRIAVLDMLLALFILAALCLFYAGYVKRKWMLYLAGFLCTAPAVLAKGPVGLAVPVVVMLAFLAIEVALGRAPAKKELLRFIVCLPAGLAIVGLFVGPWWRAAYLRSGGVYGSVSILLKQTRGRMIESYSHRQPIFYYLYNILWQLVPWTVFLPLTAWVVRKKGDLRHSQGLRFLLVWFIATFVFFTVVSGKRSQYILPLFPPAGLIIGWALLNCSPLEGVLKERKAFMVPLLVLLIGAAAGLAAFPVASFFFLRAFFWQNLAVAAIVATILFFVARSSVRRPPAFALMWLIAMMTVLASGVFGYLTPEIDTYKSARPFCAKTLDALGRDNAPIFFYRVYRPNINYYMGRSMQRIDSVEQVRQALEEKPRIFLVLEYRRLSSLEAGDKFSIRQITRNQIGSREMVCLMLNRTVAEETESP
jgi:4-amino-4-deoxy-L-arabinose transferase-like glycosyltransferase